MTHPLEIDIRAHVIDYLVGDLSLDAFKDWLVGETWGIEETEDPALIDLAYGAMLALAEAGESEPKIRDAFRPLVTDVKYASGVATMPVSSTSTSVVVTPFLIGPGPQVGRPLAAVSA